MKIDNPVASVVESIVMEEKPATILEIGAGFSPYGELFTNCQKRIAQGALRKTSYRLDRLMLDHNYASTYSCDSIYTCTYHADMLYTLTSLPVYDFIFIADFLEHTTVQAMKSVLDILQTKVATQILLITPEYSSNLSDARGGMRRNHHPVAFIKYDFSYWMDRANKDNWQFYSIFPKKEYPLIDSDCLPVKKAKARKLRVAYVLPGNELTGGLKALLQQMKHMAFRGHDIYVYLKSENKNCVLPDWSDDVIASDIKGQVVVPADKPFLDYICDVDIIILGWMKQVPEFLNSHVPVVLWEQGSEFLFGDYDHLLTSNATELGYLQSIYRSPIHLLAVSPIVQSVLKHRFNRESQLLSAGIDVDFYYPSEDEKYGHTILMVGNPELPFKNFDFALKVLQKAADTGAKFKVKWASQKQPDTKNICFAIEHYIMPTQKQLAHLYRSADIFISTSLYEAFSLPPMEAMASGTAVIATNNGGILTYAKPDKNCVIIEQGDTDTFVQRLICLLNDPDKRKSLALAGRETALQYSFDKVILALEAFLNRIVG